MFRLDEACVLDATMRGNIARYINHSCTPNCYSKVVLEPEGKPYVPGSVRGHIVIFAMRDLEPNEEVTYDYKFGVEAVKITCHCGSPRCLGVMN
jgi:SET domain-containing protein